MFAWRQHDSEGSCTEPGSWAHLEPISIRLFRKRMLSRGKWLIDFLINTPGVSLSCQLNTRDGMDCAEWINNGQSVKNSSKR
jgi:hypothetical protein